MVPDIALRPSMSVVQSVSSEEVVADERWHQWEMRNAVASRTGARRARIAFAVIFAGMGAWLRTAAPQRVVVAVNRGTS